MIELDWTTFALQILNFLVLLWLLQRFLYKPVFAVIAERKIQLDQTRAESERLRREGEELRERYERRLTEWEQEKEQARGQLLEELATERTGRLDKLRLSLEQEREMARAHDERRQAELQRWNEERSLTQGAQFAARLLARLADPGLEARILAMMCEALHGLPEDRRKAVGAAYSNGEPPVLVASAFPLNEGQRTDVTAALQSLVGRPVSCRWSEAPDLVAGVRITIGLWVLGANVRDELKFFVEAAHGDHYTASV